MIVLTRLSGSEFVLNADLIERLDNTPDTVVTLVDGTKYVVAESMLDVVDRIAAWRGQIIATSNLGEPPSSATGRSVRLATVTPHPTSAGEDH